MGFANLFGMERATCERCYAVIAVNSRLMKSAFSDARTPCCLRIL